MNKSMLQIRNEIGEWAKKNFKAGSMFPELGVLEEVGEAAHVVLKSIQGIRGYDDPVKKKTDLTDALADAGIYTLHFCSIHGIAPPEHAEFLGHLNNFGAFRMLAKSASNLIDSESSDPAFVAFNVKRIFDALFTLATANDGIRLFAAIRETWDKVQKRDWKKSPESAHLEAGDKPGPQESNQQERKDVIETVGSGDPEYKKPTDGETDEQEQENLPPLNNAQGGV